MTDQLNAGAHSLKSSFLSSFFTKKNNHYFFSPPRRLCFCFCVSVLSVCQSLSRISQKFVGKLWWIFLYGWDAWLAIVDKILAATQTTTWRIHEFLTEYLRKDQLPWQRFDISECFQFQTFFNQSAEWLESHNYRSSVDFSLSLFSVILNTRVGPIIDNLSPNFSVICCSDSALCC